MTKEEYIGELKINIMSLTEDEQKEAIQYYSDYFDEANDVEKVIAELGSPKELAKSIIERFANVPVEVEKDEKKESGKKQENFKDYSDALFYKFNTDEVKNLNCNLGAAEVVAISGNDFVVETRGIHPDYFNCSLASDGTLNVTNTKKINLSFFSHDRNNRVIPRVLITFPQKTVLNRMKIAIGAGSFETRHINLKYNSGTIDVGAGNLVLEKTSGGKTNIRCGMGRIEIEGKLNEKVNVDCGMGAVKLFVEGNPEKYSFDAKVGLGDFRLNDYKKSGVGTSVSGERKENHFSVNCGMGSVNIQIKE